MSKNTLRVGAGVAAALALTAFAWPDAGAEDPGTAGTVRAAAVSEPVVVGTVDQTPDRSRFSVLAELPEQIAEDIAAVRHVKHLEAVAVWQAEEARQAWIAGEQAAEARRVEEARLAAEAWRAGEIRAERERAAAAAAAPAGSLQEIIQRHFGAAAPEAMRIAQCESSMNPNAVSATDDHGLFQINAVHRGQFEAVTGAPWSSIYDPELNTIYARHLYGQQGWGPWTCA